ncbi:hypothetical protein WSK_3018 [Novosphingobium sp. Rr 2-17]|uniref:helix-turn-helix domain-containing protein n=1 Tax=Novosphingobium sp. Rr 2-17 TaxID=555793 RepID=UPI000269AB76|nr:helix-turn-helix domain-containing protein [Novosphingobium sp. Rr 2-17]EIZ78399.1 hypothetical protein WSK_3018 [Novosphingobium sp. Rr 2-17]
MIVQTMRLKRGWSQQQLADLSGLNVRTIQRIERGQSASVESFKALGAAFDVDFSQLQENAVRDIARTPEQIEIALAFSHVRQVRGLAYSLVSYAIGIGALAIINWIYNPHHLIVIYPAAIWGLALVWKAARVFNLLPWFGPEWERRQVEKRLGHPL